MKDETTKKRTGKRYDGTSGSILHLTLHKRWFDMIASGEKKEEYREMKPFWHKRLSKKYDYVKFVNGYGADRPWMLVELKEVLTGLGIIEWGAPESERVYILRLGKIIKSNESVTLGKQGKG